MPPRAQGRSPPRLEGEGQGGGVDNQRPNEGDFKHISAHYSPLIARIGWIEMKDTAPLPLGLDRLHGNRVDPC